MADRYTAQHDKTRDITIIFTGADTLSPKGLYRSVSLVLHKRRHGRLSLLPSSYKYPPQLRIYHQELSSRQT